MTADRDDLSELELDALTELVNLGVSRAASNLSEMVTEQVHLSVPSVLMIGRERAIEILNKSEPSKLVAVHQIFEGEVSGRALVIFPEAKSLELVRAVTSAELSLEDIIELEHEALAETGAVGGLCWLMFLILLFWNNWKILAVQKEAWNFAYHAGAYLLIGIGKVI